MTDTEEGWYRQHGVRHAHCPDRCEHPQPFMHDGKLVCGRCAVKFNELAEMIPCHCKEEVWQQQT